MIFTFIELISSQQLREKMEKERDQIACKADDVMADYEHEKQEKFAIKVHIYIIHAHIYTCIYIIHICIIFVYVYNMIHHLLYFHNIVLID